MQARRPVAEFFSAWATATEKAEGLGAEAFSSRVIRKREGSPAEVIALAVKIEEVPGSAGDYSAELTLPSEGLFELEVNYAAGGQVYSATFYAVAPALVIGGRPPGG